MKHLLGISLLALATAFAPSVGAKSPAVQGPHAAQKIDASMTGADETPTQIMSMAKEPTAGCCGESNCGTDTAAMPMPSVGLYLPLFEKKKQSKIISVKGTQKKSTKKSNVKDVMTSPSSAPPG